MMAEIFKCLGDNYSGVVLTAPERVMECIRIPYRRGKLVAIRKVTTKISKMKYSKRNIEIHLLKYSGLMMEYQGFGGKLSESELSNRLLESIPTYGIYEISKKKLQREAIRFNGGEVTLKAVNEKLRLVASNGF